MIGTPPSPRQNHVSVWTGSSRNSILIFSGYDLPTYDSEGMNDLHEFTLDTSTWSELIPNGAAGSPAKRLLASAIWVPGRGMLMHGGLDYSANYHRFADLWEFSFSQSQTGSWSLLEDDVPSGRRSEHAAVWASNLGSGGKMLIYGGNNRDGTSIYAITGSTWAYDPNVAGGQWVELDYGASRSPTSAAWSPTRRSMRVFGGRDLADEQNDVREWSSDGGWKLVDYLSGTDPPKRRFHSTVWMAREDGSEAGS